MNAMEEDMRRIKILFFIMAVTFCLVACKEKENTTFSLKEADIQEEEEDVKVQESIFVYVCGAVLEQGVYELPFGSRVYEAILMAGGFREDAATTVVNQAELLEDGVKLYIPTIAEAVAEQAEEDGRVNLNSATKEELMTLPGVGESRAESIIQYREENGSFQAIEEIMQVSGIKEGLYEKIKELITV